MTPYTELVRALPKDIILVFEMRKKGGVRWPTRGPLWAFSALMALALIFLIFALMTIALPHGAPPTMVFAIPSVLAALAAQPLWIRLPKTEHKTGRVAKDGLLIGENTCRNPHTLALALKTDEDTATRLLAEAAVRAVQDLDAKSEAERKRDEQLRIAKDRIKAMLETDKGLKLLTMGTGGERERETP